jgi:hypothetical protein
MRRLDEISGSGAAWKVLTTVGMSKLLLALVLCAWMGSFAAADRIVVTSTDQSESGLPDADRKANAETIKHVLDAWVEDQSLAADRQIDVGVVKLAVDPGDENVSVQVELRFAISDDHGQMVSVLSGTSKVSVPARTFRTKALPRLRREALIAATQAVLPKLRTHLHIAPPARVPAWSLVQLLGSWFARISPVS